MTHEDQALYAEALTKHSPAIAVTSQSVPIHVSPDPRSQAGIRQHPSSVSNLERMSSVPSRASPQSQSQSQSQLRQQPRPDGKVHSHAANELASHGSKSSFMSSRSAVTAGAMSSQPATAPVVSPQLNVAAKKPAQSSPTLLKMSPTIPLNNSGTVPLVSVISPKSVTFKNASKSSASNSNSVPAPSSNSGSRRASPTSANSNSAGRMVLREYYHGHNAQEILTRSRSRSPQTAKPIVVSVQRVGGGGGGPKEQLAGSIMSVNNVTGNPVQIRSVSPGLTRVVASSQVNVPTSSVNNVSSFGQIPSISSSNTIIPSTDSAQFVRVPDVELSKGKESAPPLKKSVMPASLAKSLSASLFYPAAASSEAQFEVKPDAQIRQFVKAQPASFIHSSRTSATDEEKKTRSASASPKDVLGRTSRGTPTAAANEGLDGEEVVNTTILPDDITERPVTNWVPNLFEVPKLQYPTRVGLFNTSYAALSSQMGSGEKQTSVTRATSSHVRSGKGETYD